jgi:alkanesulfonate monooxygenase SsuD/methylene tetrahydromethanopterin reductase-like flavin-dependent oxidoreductase (luciferase family)
MEILCERANLNAAQNSLTMNVDQFMGHLAERYRVSEEAVRVLRRALERGVVGWRSSHIPNLAATDSGCPA